MVKRSADLIIAIVLLFLVLPTLLILPLALNNASYIAFPPQGLTLRWFQAYLSDSDWRNATVFSLEIAAATTVVATIVGTMAAVALVRGKLPGKALLQALCLGPMIVPQIVFGIALFLVFSPLHLTGKLPGFVLAHSVLAVPFVVIIVSAALERIDPLLELAALSCGASRIRAFFAITLPNLAPAVATAAVFAFLTSFDEATVAFFISETDGKTISRKMFEDIDFNLTPVIAAVSAIVVAVSLLLMGTVHLLNGRRAQQ
ncbi:ABC transporter permease [Rhizobium sp. BR 362]|uniref:ABC transporter permease n=1 Tax=Rhizobium sp. BR 362 TaxID=3040670 RepID=UPI002F42BEF0